MLTVADSVSVPGIVFMERVFILIAFLEKELIQ